MSWFEALQLSLKLLQAITPIIGTAGVSGQAAVDPVCLPADVKADVAKLHAHVNAPGGP